MNRKFASYQLRASADPNLNWIHQNSFFQLTLHTYHNSFFMMQMALKKMQAEIHLLVSIKRLVICVDDKLQELILIYPWLLSITYCPPPSKGAMQQRIYHRLSARNNKEDK
jgi:hypothetical protein